MNTRWRWLSFFVLMLPTVVNAAPPNVVVILADDLGFSDLGCYGGEIQTPNLDRLADHGVRFTQFYNTARCWPSRAALLTGLYPHQAGMAMNYGPSAPPAYRGEISAACRMFPELLAAAGYRSYHVGKWHLNDRRPTPNETWPTGRGFAHSYTLIDANNYFAPKVHYDDERKLPVPTDDFYLTDAMSARAVQFLRTHAEQHAQQPFCLYLAYTAPHFPLHAKPADIAKYRGKYGHGWEQLRRDRYARLTQMGLIACPLSPRDSAALAWNAVAPAEQERWAERMAIYAAMIDCLDQGVGRVVAQLQAQQALDNTLILFLSDNGASAEYIVRGGGDQATAPAGSAASFKCLEVGWANAANTPFREHKTWVHEGGISTPAIAHWPAGLARPGRIETTPCHLIDVLPTLLELAGVGYPAFHANVPTPRLPGRSFANVFRGQPIPIHAGLFWEHEGNRAYRVGDWKLVAAHAGPWELYDLRNDRCELTNLASKYPERVQALAAAWTLQAARVGVVDWELFLQSRSKTTPDYRRK